MCDQVNANRNGMLKKEKNLNFSLLRNSFLSGTTELTINERSSSHFFSDKYEEEEFLYIEWNKFRSVDDIGRIAKDLYDSELRKLDSSPLPFHSNLEGKKAFLPDAVHDFLSIESLRPKGSYQAKFCKMFGSGPENIKSPVVKQGLGVVLFIDISGFTKLGDYYRQKYSNSPKAAADKLATDIICVINKLTEICYRHKGVVAKFAGDALICYWECDLSKYSRKRGMKHKNERLRSKEFINKVCQYLDQLLDAAKNAATAMIIAATSAKSNLKLHGGIGVGNITHLFLGKSKIEESLKYNSDGLMWYLINGYAVEFAKRLMEYAGKDKIFYLKNYRPWIESYLTSSFFNDFNSTVNHFNFASGAKSEEYKYLLEELIDENNVVPVDININKLPETPRTKLFFLNEKKRQKFRKLLNESEIDDFLPKSLKLKLQGNSILGNELLDGVSVIFVRLDDEHIRTKDFLELPVTIDTYNEDFVLGSGYRASLEYLNRTFIALSNSVKKAGGEVRDLIFDDKGCVFICAFSAHKFASHSEYRAIRASIDIVKAHDRAKIGISKGSFFVGLCGIPTRHDFIIMGDEVNFAARMMIKAENGEILVSNSVYAKLQAKLQFKMRKIQGKSRIRTCYSLVSIPESDVLSKLQPSFFPTWFDRKRYKSIIEEVFNSLYKNEPELFISKKTLKTSFINDLIRYRLDIVSNEFISNIKKSIFEGKHVFIHGNVGFGKKMVIERVARKLRKSKNFKTFSVQCSHLETNIPFLAIRKLIKIILDKEVNLSSLNKQGITKYKKRMKVKELQVISDCLEPSIAKAEVIDVLNVLLPHLKSNQANVMAKKTPSKHLESLQSLLTIEPSKDVAEKCQVFFHKFICHLSKGNLNKHKPEKTDDSSKKIKQKEALKLTSLLIHDEKFPIPTSNSNKQKQASKFSNVVVPVPKGSNMEEEKANYVIIFEDFEEIDDFSLITLEKLIRTVLPPNVILIFSMDRIQKLPARSTEIDEHREYLRRQLSFRHILEQTGRPIRDFYLEKLSVSDGVLAAKKLLLVSLFVMKKDLTSSLMKKYLISSTPNIKGEKFVDNSLQFFFTALGLTLDNSIFLKISKSSRGHPGRITCFTKKIFLEPIIELVNGKSRSLCRPHFTLNFIPLPVAGEIREQLDALPGVCVWLIKILSVIGKSFQFNLAYNISEAMYDKDSFKQIKQHKRGNQTSFSSRSDDFKSLFTHSISMLIKYHIILEEKDTTGSDYKSLVSRNSARQQFARRRIGSKLGSTNSRRFSSSFELGKIRVSSMFFSSKKLCFPSNVELRFISSLVPSSRNKEIKHLINNYWRT